MVDPGAFLTATVTATAALGFVPVAVYLDFCPLLNQIGPVADAEELTKASSRLQNMEERKSSPLCVRLTQDTMFAMAGLGLVDLVGEDTYRANAITRHMIVVPSSIHGMLHFTTEPIFASAFLMRQLVDTNFEYPFRENATPTQYGYKLLGEDKSQVKLQYLYGGKFGKFGKMPERMERLGYDLNSAIISNESDIVIVDIRGGRGDMLLEVKQEYPYLKPRNLVLQEFEPGEECTKEISVMQWDFKNDSPQPVQGALIYSLTHILHNLPNLEALRLMKKILTAMAPYSRLLIHEFSKNSTYGKMHATVIQLYAGRVRSSREWKQMAELSGLQVTFEAYPVAGEELVEMCKCAV